MDLGRHMGAVQSVSERNSLPTPDDVAMRRTLQEWRATVFSVADELDAALSALPLDDGLRAWVQHTADCDLKRIEAGILARHRPWKNECTCGLDAALARRRERIAPPLVAYMQSESREARSAAFLRTYAERIRNKTETTWEIPNTRAQTLEDIAALLEQHAPASPRAQETTP